MRDEVFEREIKLLIVGYARAFFYLAPREGDSFDVQAIIGAETFIKDDVQDRGGKFRVWQLGPADAPRTRARARARPALGSRAEDFI